MTAILEDLERRGIGFRSLSDCIDTSTPTGKLLFRITEAVAEFERTLVSERRKAGMQVARLKGRTSGRPRRLSYAQVFLAQRMAIGDEIPLDAIADKMNVSKTTIWRAVLMVRPVWVAPPLCTSP